VIASGRSHQKSLSCVFFQWVVNHLGELDGLRGRSKGQNAHFELLSDRLGMINLGRLRE